MESELEKFRRRKQLEEKKTQIKSKLKETATSWMDSLKFALLPNLNEDTIDGEDAQSSTAEPSSSTENKTDIDLTPKTNKWLIYLASILRFFAWSLVYIGFIKIGFGAVYFTVSLIIFIYFNTRKRRRGEVSAYSVFNKDCQSIDGTLKAEHLEKQLLYRS